MIYAKGRIEVVASLPEIKKMLEAGFSKSAIHRELSNQGKITVSRKKFNIQLNKQLELNPQPMPNSKPSSNIPNKTQIPPKASPAEKPASKQAVKPAGDVGSGGFINTFDQDQTIAKNGRGSDRW